MSQISVRESDSTFSEIGFLSGRLSASILLAKLLSPLVIGMCKLVERLNGMTVESSDIPHDEQTLYGHFTRELILSSEVE
jgi:hypothetical protein